MSRKFKAPRTHTIVKRTRERNPFMPFSFKTVYYFCTTCGREIEQDDINKRCKAASR